MLYAEICPKVRRHNARPEETKMSISILISKTCVIYYCLISVQRVRIDAILSL